jgi:hypothetical protein
MVEKEKEFEIGGLYVHKFPYFRDENHAFKDTVDKIWKWYEENDDGRNISVLTYIGKLDKLDYKKFGLFSYHKGHWGFFIYKDKKIIACLDDLVSIKETNSYTELLTGEKNDE